MTYHKLVLTFVLFFLATACADKRVKLWIDPPPEDADYTRSQKIRYKISDPGTGKNEVLTIPVKKIPENVSLLVDDPKSLSHSSQDTVTEADKDLFHQGKRISKKANPEKTPSISYIKGLTEIKDLYAKKNFSIALIKIHSLIGQYPKQTQLLIMRGTLLQKLGEKRSALESYKEAKLLDPHDLRIDEAILKLESEIGEGTPSKPSVEEKTP